MRRLFALMCIAAAGLVTGLTGCGSDSGGGAGRTTGTDVTDKATTEDSGYYGGG